MIQKIEKLQANGIGILKAVQEVNHPIGIYGSVKEKKKLYMQPGWKLHAIFSTVFDVGFAGETVPLC
jgi:hypothetical protein